MIRLTEQLWIGGADEWRNAIALGIGGVLCVAQDLRGRVGWPEVEYMQVGLVDGPGNPISAYIGAVMALDVLVKRHRTAAVCCHGGSRSMAVCLMYLDAINHLGWERMIEMLGERADVDLPTPHAAHRDAYEKIGHQLLAQLIGE